MRIAFVGLPLAALLLAADGHEIVWAGICRKKAIGTRRLVRLLGSGSRVAVIMPKDLADHADAIRAAKPDLLVSWFWTKRVPAEVRSIAKRGAIGVHPSLLPRHRGPDPTFWAIDSGDKETGVTAHVLDDDYDTGAMLGKRSITIDPEWNSWTLAKKLDRPSLALLRDVVRAYARGEAPTPEEQNEADATDAPQLEEEELELQWKDPAAKIARRIRAASPWPGAFTELAGEILTITHARVVTTDIPRALDTGEAYVRADGVAVVRAGDANGIELHAARIANDDDSERVLDARDIAELIRSRAH